MEDTKHAVVILKAEDAEICRETLKLQNANEVEMNILKKQLDILRDESSLAKKKMWVHIEKNYPETQDTQCSIDHEKGEVTIHPDNDAEDVVGKRRGMPSMRGMDGVLSALLGGLKGAAEAADKEHTEKTEEVKADA